MIFTRNNYCQDIPFDWFAKSHRIKKPSILNLTKIEIRGDCLLTHGARACFPCCQVRLECNPPWLTEKRRGEIREGKRGGLTDSPLSHIKTIRLFRPFPTCSQKHAGSHHKFAAELGENQTEFRNNSHQAVVRVRREHDSDRFFSRGKSPPFPSLSYFVAHNARKGREGRGGKRKSLLFLDCPVVLCVLRISLRA